MTYLGTRNVAIFSCDVDSFDFRAKDATQIINSVLTKLEKSGKGIILMHDFQRHTAEALPLLLRRLKGRRLQGRADEGQGAAADTCRVRRCAGQGHETCRSRARGRSTMWCRRSPSSGLRALERIFVMPGLVPGIHVFAS